MRSNVVTRRALPTCMLQRVLMPNLRIAYARGAPGTFAPRFSSTVL